jgi:endonuclease/exonuclease/phosphatase family metal-dependent hydrolase
MLRRAQGRAAAGWAIRGLQNSARLPIMAIATAVHGPTVRRFLCALVACVALLPRPLPAMTDVALTAGKGARVARRAARARFAARFVGDPRLVLPVPDPTCGAAAGAAAARLVLRSDAATLEIDLPCEHWRAIRRGGYRYQDRTRSAGGVWRITVGAGKLVVHVGGRRYASAALPGPTTALEVGLVIGATRWCGRFEAPTSKFSRNDAGGVVVSGPSIACFEEFPWRGDEPDVRAERLCREAAGPDDPEITPDTTFIDCALEGATFATSSPPKDALVVLAYNILRGFEVDAQLDAILGGAIMPRPDVLLLSEVDRGCRRTDFRNIAREYAEALGYYYVYATEFVELPGTRGSSGPYDPPLCEHGNAIVARYPLGNVRQIRHAENRSWYTPPGFPDPDEPRLGGRVAVAADMHVGGRLVRLYSLHLESTLTTLAIRDAQAREIAEDARDVPHVVLVGGDLNAYSARADLQNGTMSDGPTQAFLTAGFVDTHASLPVADRFTSFDILPLIIDFVFVRGAAPIEPGVCARVDCESLSDHMPIWTTVVLPAVD